MDVSFLIICGWLEFVSELHSSSGFSRVSVLIVFCLKWKKQKRIVSIGVDSIVTSSSDSWMMGEFMFRVVIVNSIVFHEKSWFTWTCRAIGSFHESWHLVASLSEQIFPAVLFPRTSISQECDELRLGAPPSSRVPNKIKRQVQENWLWSLKWMDATDWFLGDQSGLEPLPLIGGVHLVRRDVF